MDIFIKKNGGYWAVCLTSNGLCYYLFNTRKYRDAKQYLKTFSSPTFTAERAKRLYNFYNPSDYLFPETLRSLAKDGHRCGKTIRSKPEH